jgi:threonine dehydrogenase-like Zn-dependent dehydrogenase
VPRSARVEEVPEPPQSDGSVLVRALALGVCGTDVEILRGWYGVPPRGERRLVLGHESLGEVIEAPRDSGVCAGDLVVGIVRHPDPVPCESCAAEQWDMCQNGLYTEHGIKGRHGFGSERFRLEPRFAVKIDRELTTLGVLLEPASIAAKAWDQIEKIGARALWRARKAVVFGAGPIGLMAALGAAQRGLEVEVLARESTGPKPELVRALGATYRWGDVEEVGHDSDVLLECTGAPSLIASATRVLRANGIACLLGISPIGQIASIDVGAFNQKMVLANHVVFGSVNANRAHYLRAAGALLRADRRWLEGMITRRAPLERWYEAFDRGSEQIKSIILFEGDDHATP